MFDEIIEKKLVVETLNEFEPKFIDSGELTKEQLTDPDYAIKRLIRIGDGKIFMPCAKCHHCR